MKQKLLLHRFATVALTLGIFLSGASLAHAETLTLPQHYSYAGLTFSEPLLYADKTPKVTAALSFSSHPQFGITPTNQQKPLETIIITPTSITSTQIEPSVFPTPIVNPLPTKTLHTSTLTTASTHTTQPAPYTPAIATPTPPPPAAVATNPGGLNPDVLFSMVNAYRQAKGLPAFQKDDKTCSLAASRAPEIAGEIAAGTMHSGLATRHLPYWNTENIISMNSENAAFTWWINDTIHREAIESNNTYSCVACSGNACSEEFTSYQPK